MLWAELAVWLVAAGVSVGWVLGVVAVAEEGLVGNRASGLAPPMLPPPPCADSVSVSMGSIECYSAVSWLGLGVSISTFNGAGASASVQSHMACSVRINGGGF